MESSYRRLRFLGFGFGLAILAGCGAAASAPHPAPHPKLHTKSFFDPSLANADQYVAFHVTRPSQTAGYQPKSIYVTLPPTASLRPKDTQITLTYQGASGTFQLMETALPMQIGGSGVKTASVQGHTIQSQALTVGAGEPSITVQTRYHGVSYQLTVVEKPGSTPMSAATADAILLSALP